jgi:hypothetical protein
MEQVTIDKDIIVAFVRCDMRISDLLWFCVIREYQSCLRFVWFEYVRITFVLCGPRIPELLSFGVIRVCDSFD